LRPRPRRGPESVDPPAAGRTGAPAHSSRVARLAERVRSGRSLRPFSFGTIGGGAHLSRFGGGGRAGGVDLRPLQRRRPRPLWIAPSVHARARALVAAGLSRVGGAGRVPPRSGNARLPPSHAVRGL